MKVAQEHVTHAGHAFRFMRFRIDGSAGDWHRHRQIELTWIERGAGIRFVGDNAAPYGDGDLVLLGPWVPHLWLSSPLAPGEEATATVIQFPPELLEQPALPELAALQALADRAAAGLRVQGAAHAAVTAQMAAMRDHSPLQRLAALVGALDALGTAVAEDLRPIATRAVRGEAEPGNERRIQRVIAWVHRHLAQPLPVADAAAVAHISPAAFSRFFRRETGKAYTAYVNELRCSAACLRLRRTDHPVARIAEECGFRNLSHFNRCFRAKWGQAPGAYRRQVRR